MSNESTDLAHNEGPMSELTGAKEWINSPPLTSAGLMGKVVLIDFWTYSCINCLRTLPYIRDWADKYGKYGLVVIGVHTPEFAFEKDPEHVKKAVKELGITYPVALDSDYSIWNRFKNQYWPAHYFVDAQGLIRHHHFGEGGYEKSEMILQQLLRENHQNVGEAINSAEPSPPATQGGVQLAGSDQAKSPETYIGYDRASNFVINPPPKKDESTNYFLAANLQINQWSLGGQWEIQDELAQLTQGVGKIAFRFHARDLHLVLGVKENAQNKTDPDNPSRKTIRFVVKIDGAIPGLDHGTDIDETGIGQVREHRLYQLIRQNGQKTLQDRTFEIEFLDPDVQAFAFTFG